jgi:anaerobic magnesium-protoporphyrin IX monomethyl ester cyclase
MAKPRIALIALYTDYPVQEMGLQYVASYVRREGYEVLLLGGVAEQMDYDRLLQFAPDVVGITAYQDTLKGVRLTAETARRLLPQAAICLGGAAATFHHREMLTDWPFVDYVVRGEGEVTFHHLVTCLETGADVAEVQGLSYRRGDEVVVNPERPPVQDLDSLPWPARDLLPETREREAVLYTSRGCTRRCRFCASEHYRKSWRGGSISRSLDEVEELIAQHAVCRFAVLDFSFEDPGGAVGLSRMREFAEGLLARGLRIGYDVQMRAEVRRLLDADTLRLLKRAGLYLVFLGLEAGNEDDLRLYGKIATVEDNEAILRLFALHEIDVHHGFIMFNPYSTFARLRQNLDLLARHGLAAHFWRMQSKLELYPGTALAAQGSRDGIIRQARWDDPYTYQFLDARIEQFSLWLDGWLSRVFEDHWLKRCFASHLERGMLAFFRIYCENAGLEEERALVLAAEREKREVEAELSARSTRWFGQLLDLAETGWEPETAQQIADRELGRKYLGEVAGRVAFLKARLCRELARRRPELDLITHGRHPVPNPGRHTATC